MDETRRNLALSLILATCIVGTVLVAFMLLGKLEGANQQASIPWPTLTRFQVNEAVFSLMERGRSEDVFAFYQQFTRTRDRAIDHVMGSLTSRVPINTTLAIAAWESYWRKMRDGPNLNGSFDIGDMKLNTLTFKGVPEWLLVDPNFNIPKGIAYLAQWHSQGVGWETSVAAYNAGRIAGTGDGKSFEYVGAVLWYERLFDLLFSRRFQGEIEWKWEGR